MVSESDLVSDFSIGAETALGRPSLSIYARLYMRVFHHVLVINALYIVLFIMCGLYYCLYIDELRGC